MYEVSGKVDKATVVNYTADDALPGKGFATLLIRGEHPDGTRELLELRFKSDFLRHICNLRDALLELSKDEEERTEGIIEAAQAVINSYEEDPDD